MLSTPGVQTLVKSGRVTTKQQSYNKLTKHGCNFFKLSGDVNIDMSYIHNEFHDHIYIGCYSNQNLISKSTILCLKQSK